MSYNYKLLLPEKLQNIFQIILFLSLASVVLIGGTVNGTGNVYARNPATGIYGPVCDDLWSIEDVSSETS